MGELSCTYMSVTKCRSYIGYIGCLGHRHCRQGTRFTKLSTNILINLRLKHTADRIRDLKLGGRGLSQKLIQSTMLFIGLINASIMVIYTLALLIHI